MSRRENCVWHPMPEEVRRSSVQSRRASLTAGRRKNQQGNGAQPDWEVEAPPTPPADDHRSREASPAAASAARDPSPGTDGGAGEAWDAKTRHVLRFHGPNWKKLKGSEEDIKKAVVQDLWDGAQVKAEEAKNMTVSWEEWMVVTFTLLHPKSLKSRQLKIHSMLKECSFPHVNAMYPAKA